MKDLIVIEKAGKFFFYGLLDIGTLKKKYAYDSNQSGQKSGQSALSRPQVMPLSGQGRFLKSVPNDQLNIVSEENQKIPQNFIYTDSADKFASYSQINHALAAKGVIVCDGLRGLM